MTKSDLQAIADMAQEHDLLVVADEIYEKIVFDGLKCTSIASLDGMKERTIMINGFSKTYAMTGWRLGYMAGPKAMVDEILKIHQLTVAAAPTFCQMAGVAALEGSQEPVKKMVSEYQRRRDFAREMLGKTDLSCVRPRGAFYIYPNISDVGLTSSDFVTKLLNETGVAIVPGVAFGDDDHVRISLTESLENLKVAFERILSFLEHM